MKRVLANIDLFRILKELDNKVHDKNIGIVIVSQEIPERDIRQICANGWGEDNRLFLIIDDFNPDTLKTLISCIKQKDFLYGVCFDCEVDYNTMIELSNALDEVDVNCFVNKNKINEQVLTIPTIKAVDTFYDI